MKKLKLNLIGTTLNYLTIIKISDKKGKRNETYFDCQCKCGKMFPVRSDLINNKKRISCGCHLKPNLIGIKFNKLTVIRDSGKRYNPGHEKYWECLCECGKTCDVRTSIVNKGKRISCGCVIKSNGKEHPHWTGNGDIPGSFYVHLQNRAKDRNLEFNLTIEYLWQLFLKQNRKCRFSGVELKFEHNQRQRRFRTVSLDRIDSTKGYIEGNVQWVHKHINFMKLSLSDEEFINWCKLVVENNKV